MNQMIRFPEAVFLSESIKNLENVSAIINEASISFKVRAGYSSSNCTEVLTLADNKIKQVNQEINTLTDKYNSAYSEIKKHEKKCVEIKELLREITVVINSLIEKASELQKKIDSLSSSENAESKEMIQNLMAELDKINRQIQENKAKQEKVNESFSQEYQKALEQKEICEDLTDKIKLKNQYLQELDAKNQNVKKLYSLVQQNYNNDKVPERLSETSQSIDNVCKVLKAIAEKLEAYNWGFNK